MKKKAVLKNYYSEDEICLIYKNADERQDRIKLLQELTLLTEKEVEEILKKNGYVVEKVNKQRFLHFYSQGHTDAKIARWLKVSEGTIRYWRQKYGLPANYGKVPDKKMPAGTGE